MLRRFDYYPAAMRNIILDNPRTHLTLAMAAALAVLLLNAWVAEDAFFTYRVVDNFVDGFGLRWNVDGRVQVYTHPLWMMLHIPLYAAFGHIILVSTVLSLACTATALIAATSIPAGSALPQLGRSTLGSFVEEKRVSKAIAAFPASTTVR